MQTHNLIVIDSPTPIFQAKKYCTSNLGIWKKNPDMMEKNPPKQFHVQLVHYSSLFPSIPIVVRHSNTTYLSSLSSATSQVSNPWLSSHGEIERMSLECPVIRKMIGKPFGWYKYTPWKKSTPIYTHHINRVAKFLGSLFFLWNPTVYSISTLSKKEAFWFSQVTSAPQSLPVTKALWFFEGRRNPQSCDFFTNRWMWKTKHEIKH